MADNFTILAIKTRSVQFTNVELYNFPPVKKDVVLGQKLKLNVFLRFTETFQLRSIDEYND